MEKQSSLGILDVLLVVFIVLKLVGVIHWSWWVVLAPLWVQLVLLGIALLFIYINSKSSSKKINDFFNYK